MKLKCEPNLIDCWFFTPPCPFVVCLFLLVGSPRLKVLTWFVSSVVVLCLLVAVGGLAMDKPLFKDFSSCDSVDEFFSQFVYKPDLNPSVPSSSYSLARPLRNLRSTSATTDDDERAKGKKVFLKVKEKGARKQETKGGKKKKTSSINNRYYSDDDDDDDNKDRKDKEEKKEKKKKTEKKLKRKSVTLTAEQRRSEPYRRVPKDHPWVPPVSPHQLIQEFYYHDAWKILVICLLCNRTRGDQARKVLEELFSLCPSAEATIDVPVEMIEEKIRFLGFHRKRSLAIKRLSWEYLEDWVYVTDLYSVGKYAADAYAIFCSGHWKEVKPVDHKLVDYWKFLHKEEKKHPVS